MNTCQKCGNTLSLEAKFCNVCGEKIIHKVFCTNCGRELKEERFCPDCGTLSPTLRTFNSNPTQQFSGTYQGSTYQAQQYNYTRTTTNNKKSFIKIDRVLPIMRDFSALSLTIIGTILAICFVISSIITITEEKDLWWLPTCSSILLALCLSTAFRKLGKAMEYEDFPTAGLIKSIGILFLISYILQGLSYIGFIDNDFELIFWISIIASGIIRFVIFILSIIQLIKLQTNKYNGRIIYPAIIISIFSSFYSVLTLSHSEITTIIALILNAVFVYVILYFTTKLISTSDENELVDIL